jgi:hypothetical protein
MTNPKYNETHLAFEFRKGYQHGHAQALRDIQKLVKEGLSLEAAIQKCYQFSEDKLHPWRSSANEHPTADVPRMFP